MHEDNNEGRSWSSYNVKYMHPSFTIHKPYKPGFNWKKFLHRIIMAVLVGAVLGLLYVNWYEAQVIAQQRHLIFQMWQYIQSSCSPEMLQ